MREESMEGAAMEAARLLVPRAEPDADFVQSLGQSVQRAAYQRFGRPRPSFDLMVIELRKLVRLLRRTLVPVHPRSAFVRALEHDLQETAHELMVMRQERVWWLLLGGVLGTVLSLLGVLAALLLRRKNGRLQTKKPLGAR
ncbi:MAG: hypothetical protein ACK2UX_03855 [Anaerolineae bacterium]|jgi:hypothetical protein